MKSTLTAVIVAVSCGANAPAEGVRLADSMQDVKKLPVLNELPDPFLMNSGKRVRTREDWAKRRGEIIESLTHYEYGHMPPLSGAISAEITEAKPIFDGGSTKTRGTLSFGPGNKLQMRVGLYVPTTKKGPFPVVLAIEPVWMQHLEPVARLVNEHGYIFAGYERHDLDRDDDDRSDGVHPLYSDYDWASLAVWAWGAMRVVDYLHTLDEVDTAHIALTGHSRAGKTALLAGALDERITLTVPHASGAGGSGSYRILGESSESLAAITDPKRFHYWFHPRLAFFAGSESRLPFDQHFLKALVAPRGLLAVEGLEDAWANPLGTQQMHVATQPVYNFLGASDKIGIYYRCGGHDTVNDDWEALLEFADHIFFGKPTTRNFDQRPFPNEKPGFTWTTPITVH